MKKHLFAACLVFVFFTTQSQDTNDKKFIKISQSDFNRHQPVINFLIKPVGIAKSGGIIKIKTPRKTIVLKDDGEMLGYRVQGDVKNSRLLLIHELEPNHEEYYLINKDIGTIDT